MPDRRGDALAVSANDMGRIRSVTMRPAPLWVGERSREADPVRRNDLVVDDSPYVADMYFRPPWAGPRMRYIASTLHRVEVLRYIGSALRS